MMSFGEVCKDLAIGGRAAREGWNGKNMFIFLVVGNSWSFDSDVEGIDELDTSSFICMRTADRKLTPWVPSQADVMSYDWVILPD